MLLDLDGDPTPMELLIEAVASLQDSLETGNAALALQYIELVRVMLGLIEQDALAAWEREYPDIEKLTTRISLRLAVEAERRRRGLD